MRDSRRPVTRIEREYETVRCIYCAATPTSGVRHRFLMLRSILHFARSFGYKTVFYWGATSGVGYCGFDELFAPEREFSVGDISDDGIRRLRSCLSAGGTVSLGHTVLPVFLPGQQVPQGSFFSWDLLAAGSLRALTSTPMPPLKIRPTPMIEAQAELLIDKYQVTDRIGIRVRVSESARDARRPHRSLQEMNEVAAWLMRIPADEPVFIATDSEYLQDKLRSHFVNALVLPKSFEAIEASGRYVGRQDASAMKTYLLEVECLCACRGIFNIGGFHNENSFKHKFFPLPRHLGVKSPVH